jgi:hypothetical protein
MTAHSLSTLSTTEAVRVSPEGIHSGCDITIQNLDSVAYVYLGSGNVTVENFGYRLAPNTAVSFELPGKDALYAITDTNESKVAILKTNLENGS